MRFTILSPVPRPLPCFKPSHASCPLQNWLCYPAYCLGASCPCCVGDAREQVAEKYNLPISEWEPDNCGWCIVKLIGTRLMCFASVCLLPCFHVAQMRAEIAFRRHGKPTVCPCCCCWCGGGDAPGVSAPEGGDLDYPRDVEVKRKESKKEAAADYPRAGGKAYTLESEKKKVEVVADYPHAGGRKTYDGLASESDVKVVADYPHEGGREYTLGSDEYAPPVPDYPHAGGREYAVGEYTPPVADYPR